MEDILLIQPIARCFNCPRTDGAVGLYKCSRCETALYCSENCRINDLPSHSINCMPRPAYHSLFMTELKTLSIREKFSWLVCALLYEWGNMESTHIYCKIVSPVGQDVIVCRLSHRLMRPRKCHKDYGCLMIDQQGNSRDRYSMRTILEYSPKLCKRAANDIIGLVPAVALPNFRLNVMVSQYDICVYVDDRAFIF